MNFISQLIQYWIRVKKKTIRKIKGLETKKNRFDE
jgi:hypothetical protein